MAPRGPKPKPFKLRIVGHRADRPIPAEEDQIQLPPDMPEAPAHLHAYALEEWARVAPDLYGVGILTSVDRGALAGYCQAYARWRLCEEKLAEMAKNDEGSAGMLAKTKNGNVIQNPILLGANNALRDMVRFAAEFGMTPSARARIDSKRAQGEDPIATKYGIR